MRKIVSYVLIAAAAMLIGACGDDDTRPETVSREGMRWAPVRSSVTPAPDWVNAPAWEAGSENNEQVYYVLVEGEAKTKDKARIAAELEKVTAIAAAVKEISTTMLASSCAGMLNDDAGLETYFEKTTAAVSRNVDTSGAFPVNTYWEYGQYIDDNAGTAQDVYRYVIRYAISQRQLDTAMARAWQDTGGGYSDAIIDRVRSNVPALANVPVNDNGSVAQASTTTTTVRASQNDTRTVYASTTTTSTTTTTIPAADNGSDGGRVRGQDTGGNAAASADDGRLRGQNGEASSDGRLRGQNESRDGISATGILRHPGDPAFLRRSDTESLRSRSDSGNARRADGSRSRGAAGRGR